MTEKIVRYDTQYGTEYVVGEVGELIRCGQCKHWHRFIDIPTQGRCDKVGIAPPPTEDWFCGDGERKEN